MRYRVFCSGGRAALSGFESTASDARHALALVALHTGDLFCDAAVSDDQGRAIDEHKLRQLAAAETEADAAFVRASARTLRG